MNILKLITLCSLLSLTLSSCVVRRPAPGSDSTKSYFERSGEAYPLLYIDGTDLNEIPHLRYLQVVGERAGFLGLGERVKINIDIGQTSATWMKSEVQDERGFPLLFNSMVDVMNALHAQGWNLEDSYVLRVGDKSVYHHIFKKND